MRQRGDDLLAGERPPFWGRSRGRPAELTAERQLVARVYFATSHFDAIGYTMLATLMALAVAEH